MTYWKNYFVKRIRLSLFLFSSLEFFFNSVIWKILIDVFIFHLCNVFSSQAVTSQNCFYWSWMEYNPYLGNSRAFMTSQIHMWWPCAFRFLLMFFSAILDQILLLEDSNPVNAKNWRCYLCMYKTLCSCFSSQKQPITTFLAATTSLQLEVIMEGSSKMKNSAPFMKSWEFFTTFLHQELLNRME